MRKSGVLLPVASIPSRFGIGTFSKEAYAFVDFLVEAGQKIWQILPLGPTGYGDSPYQSFSTFAGNPYYIDLEELISENLITEADCENCDDSSHPSYVDYEKIYFTRFQILRKAYENAMEKDRESWWGEYEAFCKENGYWLEDYALYMTVKSCHHGAGWIEWQEDIKLRKTETIQVYQDQYGKDISFYKYLQYLFFRQWKKLKAYANEKGIEIVGDIPIYVAFDSADTWSNPELFMLDEKRVPLAVAGCPPDAFSETGQLWGNPLYHWEYHKTEKYDWWMKRFSHNFTLYDRIRIDHFRGFDEFWAIPYGDKTAQNGKWLKGPGYELFEVLEERLPGKKVIAEDLGFLTESVYELLRKTGYPGMKVLEFAFDGEDSLYLPHNHIKNTIVYTGTHDNDTVVGWYSELGEKTKKYVQDYLGFEKENEVAQKMIQAALASVADTAIIPIQDYLKLGREARINTPATLGDNWKWRIQTKDLTEELANHMKHLSKVYCRC